MNLSAYNDKTVRITDLNGDVFDGACLWNPNEYMFVEFGQDEEALQIDDWIFDKSDIADVRLLPEGAETLWYNRPMHKMSLASVVTERVSGFGFSKTFCRCSTKDLLKERPPLSAVLIRIL